jgi:drug/metabolite transporter (DMT)-like permease
MKHFSGLFIILAGCFWGIMGVFVRLFTAFGFTTIQIAALRLTVAALSLFVGLLVFRPNLLKIKMRDLPLLFVLGIFSIGIMSVLYFTTIAHSSMAVAAVLLYLSPVAVMLMSRLFFKEKLTTLKLISLVLAVVGCGLVSGIIGGHTVGWQALLTGVGSAVAYGSYSIIGPLALKKHHPFTVTAYAFFGAAMFLLCLSHPLQMVTCLSVQPSPYLAGISLLGLGLCTAVTPFVLYTLGLQHTAPSKAAVLACSEPVAATIFGWLFYGEIPDVFGFLGIVLVVASILLSSFGKTTSSPQNPVLKSNP